MVEKVQCIDNKWYKTYHLSFKDDGPWKPGAKTRIFNVFNAKHSLIGVVKWWGAWRCYCYFPLDLTLYDKGCLRQLADFCEYITDDHKSKLNYTIVNRERLKEKRENRIKQIKARKDLTNMEKSDMMVDIVKEE